MKEPDESRHQLPSLLGPETLLARAAEQMADTYGGEVLFVCVHNASRSQIAAALLDHHAHGRVHVRAAGSVPADSINPAMTQEAFSS